MRPAIQLVGVSKRSRRQTDRHATSLKTYLVRDLWRRRAEPVGARRCAAVTAAIMSSGLSCP